MGSWNPSQENSAWYQQAKTQNQLAPGSVAMQGTGVTTQYNQPVQDVGGFQTGGYQYGLPSAGAIQGSLGGEALNTGYINPAQAPVGSVQSGSPYMQKMQDAYWNQATSRLDPQWQQRQSDLETQLANMGLSRGSEAWNREMGNLNTGRNDAYGSALNQAILNSGQEAARLQGMDINAGNFQNQWNQQGFQNQLASQQAQNAALGQRFQQGLAQGNFANQAQQQNWNQLMGQAQLNNAALGSQQQGALGWGQLEAQKKAAESQATGMGQIAAAQSGAAAAQREIAMRQLQNAERQQDFDMSRQMYYDPLITQNMLMQGMYPTGSPDFSNFAQAQYQPTTGWGAQGQGQSGMMGGFGNILGSLGGFFGF